MANVTQILSQIQQGDPSAAEQLLPLVYQELRKLAAAKMASEKPGQTLQGTALVHEAYLRLVKVEKAQGWDSRGHFFSAAAEAMRRILVEAARRKKTARHGGGRERLPLEGIELPTTPEELLDLSEALDRLEQLDRKKAELVKLRYFAGMTIPEAASALGISTTTADRYWAYSRVWLHQEIASGGKSHVESGE
ncbi:MAG: RNA polymerase subunit sigma [Planctomycetaceae bacterium]|nr:RNA polymerase subunit sigma [Planctomycetaceae bacterium]